MRATLHFRCSNCPAAEDVPVCGDGLSGASAVAPAGWVADANTGACYCPGCWASIQNYYQPESLEIVS